MKFYYVYILESEKDSQWYTGYSSNLKKRISEHKEGLSTSTKNRRPLKLIYFEGCISKKDALAREKYLKSGMGKRYLRNRLKSYFKVDF
ncbi:MAG TPA: excinuclease ABC subunit C [Balneola sp.]|nr:excinuclease ABC subunit C [Bacteroidota bacterium]MAB66515.1 excinuclease ABC subunit C [Bacteroidota bacterium]HCT53319.1 excinuclease ABC subunit C [Balneola sp.]|tara:strand:- start:261 stop:527 length:267 start_codon:yes stop_codon:yes gene_type:complete